MFSLRLTLPALGAVILLLAGTTRVSAGQGFLRAAAETNVNQRYTIESVSVGGVQIANAKIPSSLRHRLNALVGERCDIAMLEDLAGDLRRELRLQAVNHRLFKGSAPGRIRVNFDVIRKDVAFDLSIPKLLYHSALGWTGELQASTRIRQNELTIGATNNGDTLSERFSGVVVHYENTRLVSDHVHLGVTFENYQDRWSDEAYAAANSMDDLYRARRNIAPELTFSVARNLTVSGGMSFGQMTPQIAGNSSRAANAFTGEVRYGRKIEGDSDQQTLDATYSVRAGSRALGSDYTWSRQVVTLRYELRAGHQTASDDFTAGDITGEAPLFDRFVLGNSSTLRGWEGNEIAPLGGTRVVHNSLSWGYQTGEGTAEVFYDAGALGHTGRPQGLRHSIGLGYRQRSFFVTMAFPIVEGRIAPLVIAGMNY